jgi:saccharopine dehydrogenase-like NADP-dependent oxidoreductase
MTPPLLDYLCSFKDTKVTIGSNLVEDAKKLCLRHPDYLTAEFLDVFNAAEVEAMVQKHDVVISFIPPWMHMHVFKPCLKHGVNVVTSSYISPEMLALHDEA